MNEPQSDALVFFGATGDLAHKRIFPALQEMIKRGTLAVPVIGVARSGWQLSQLQERARDSLEQHGGVDAAAFARLLSLLSYIDGDYTDPATFRALRVALGAARCPAHYLVVLFDDSAFRDVLTPILPDYPLQQATLYVVYASRKFVPPKLRTFVDFIVEFLARLRRSSTKPLPVSRMCASVL